MQQATQSTPIRLYLLQLVLVKVSGVDLDPDEALASANKLFQIPKREGVTLTIFGHDGEQWATLTKAPDYYE